MLGQRLFALIPLLSALFHAGHALPTPDDSVTTHSATTVAADLKDQPCTTNAECLRLGRPLLRPKRRQQTVAQFEYTGSVQTFVVPQDGDYFFSVSGASGGATDYTTSAQGGQINITYT